MKPNRALLDSPAMRGADAALKRAAKSALELARRTGTPCWTWQDGRLVDISKGDAADRPFENPANRR